MIWIPRWCGHSPRPRQGLRKHTAIKTSGDDGISAELFQILQDDAVKMLHSICQWNGKLALTTGLEKVSFHFNPKDGQCQRMFQPC